MGPGQPEYELARAIFAARHRVSGASFDEMDWKVKGMLIAEAEDVIKVLDENDFCVMHEDNIDGG